jgi:tetratricopeptide (TPR) repeat protein
MDCLDETMVARLLDRSLSSAETVVLVHHIDGCEDCRALVSALAKSHTETVASELTTFASGFAPTPSPHPLDAEPPPERLGRYEVTGSLGRGATGAVYAARDPELGRELAIKLLRVGPGVADAARERLLREAKALAKVSHPNVVAIYDVGVADDHVFLAMELVKSGTLRDWLVRPRSLDTIVRVMTDVGRGLAAVHACGLVHRDIKPDNILVDAHGRGRIGDFGLAAVVDDTSTAVDADDPDAGVTRTGTIAGTPAYMAPEQFAHRAIDARTDQFGFCVTLYEALVGERPYPGGTHAELAKNVLAGNIREPRRALPTWIRAVIVRGLAVDPAERFSTTDALVAALARPRSRRRVLAIATLAGAAVIAGTVGATWALRGSGEPSCPTAAVKLDRVWGPARRLATQRSLAAAGELGVRAAERTIARLDRYAGRWAAAWTETCETERGAESTALFDLRVACLSRRLRALDALVGTLATPDPAIAAKASELADGLEPLAPCDDTSALLRAAPPPGIAWAVAGIDSMVDDIGTLRVRGQYREAAALADRAVANAHALGYRPGEAFALIARSGIERDVDRFADAEASLSKASSLAIAGGDDFTAAEALIALVDVVGYRLGRPAEAHRLAELARASLERAGDPRALRLQLYNATSKVALLEGKHAEALAAIDNAIALAEQAAGDDNGELEDALSAKGVVLFELGRYAEAMALMARELDLRERAEGARHPAYASALENRANLYFATNQFDKGVADLHIARRIYVEAFGSDTVAVAELENNLGVIAGELGDWTEALRAARAAVVLVGKRSGADHPDVAKARANVGKALRELGRLDEAEPLLVDTLAARERALGPHHAEIANGLDELAELRLAQQRPREAIELYRRARDIFVGALGNDNPMVAYALSGLGRAQLAAGDPTAARATLAQAIASLDASKIDPVLIARTRLAFADAKWQLGDRDGARAEASRAEPALAPLPAASNAVLRDDIAHWRAQH